MFDSTLVNITSNDRYFDYTSTQTTEFSLNILLNSVTKIKFDKIIIRTHNPYVLETKMLPLCQEDTGSKEDF